jgi:hypothetical protein
MNTFVQLKENTHGRVAANEVADRDHIRRAPLQSVADRGDAVFQSQLDQHLNESGRVESQTQLKQLLNQSPRLREQAKLTQTLSSCTSALRAQQLVQRRGSPEEDNLLEGQRETGATIQRAKAAEDVDPLLATGAPVQKRENTTGLPDELKTGVEKLSGLAMDDVVVKYNSPAPARFQALAYTQGTEIHVAPGQEKHLGHEAWHAVQQRQGRVQPRVQTKNVPINDDSALEREADEMGTLAVSSGLRGAAMKQRRPDGQKNSAATAKLQRSPAGVIQLLSTEQKKDLTPVAELIGRAAKEVFRLTGALDVLKPVTPLMMKEMMESLLPELAAAVKKLSALIAEIPPGDTENLILRAARATILHISKQIYEQDMPTIDQLISGELEGQEAIGAFAALKQTFKLAYSIYSREQGVLDDLTERGVSLSFSSGLFEEPTPSKGMIYKAQSERISSPEPLLAAKILQDLKRRQIKHVEFLNYTHRHYRNTSALLHALLDVAKGSKALGSVTNLLVPMEGADEQIETAMVKIIVSPEGNAQILIIDTRVPTVATQYQDIDQAKKAIAAKFGLKGITDGDTPWTLHELAELEIALNKLPLKDRKILFGLTIHREIAAKPKKGSLDHPLASYHPGLHVVTIHNLAFAQDAGSFVGASIESAAPAVTLTILHEIGHVLESTEAMQRRLQIDRQIEEIETEIVKLRESLLITGESEQLEKEAQQLSKQEEELDEQLRKTAQAADLAASDVVDLFSSYGNALQFGIDIFYKDIFPRIKVASVPLTLLPKCENHLKLTREALDAMLKIKRATFSTDEPATLAKLIEAAEASRLSDKEALECSEFPRLDILLAQLKKALQILAGAELMLDNAAHAKKQYEELDEHSRVLQKQIEILRVKLREAGGHKREIERIIVDLEMKKSDLDLESGYLLIDSSKSKRLAAFEEYVKKHKIQPITGYAITTVAKGNYQEMFAEAYAIFAAEPEFLETFHPELYAYFASEKY